MIDDTASRLRAEKRIRAAKILRLLAQVAFGSGIGCADPGCLYGHARGMQTNGGCQCLKGTDATLRAHAKRLRHLLFDLLMWKDKS